MGTFVVPSELSSWLNAPRDGTTSIARMWIGERSLQFAYIGKVSDKEIILRLSIDEAGGEKGILRRSFALTEREADVLLWISSGKVEPGYRRHPEV